MWIEASDTLEILPPLCSDALSQFHFQSIFNLSFVFLHGTLQIVVLGMVPEKQTTRHDFSTGVGIPVTGSPS